MHYIFGGSILAYLFVAWCLWKIARDMSVGDEWLAWVPFFNLFILLRAAGRPAWYVLFLLLPLVNFVVAAMVFLALAERRGRLLLYGLLLFVPVINLLVLFSLTSVPARR